MRRTSVAAAALTLMLVVACSGGSPTHPRPAIDVGVDLPLTGPEAPAARTVLNGFRFFFERHPTLDGFDIVLTPQDDAHGSAASPDLGLGNVQRFIADPRLVAMLGPLDSAVARKEIPAANAAGLPMVTPVTSSPCLTRDVYLPAALNPARTAVTCKDAGLPAAAELRSRPANNFFRLATTDDLQGPAAADYAVKTLHLLRVGVVSDHESYGEALADGFTARFQKLGGLAVGHLDLNPASSQDVPGWLRQMKAAGAQGVYFGGAGGQGCAIRAGMSGLFDGGEAAPFFGGDGTALDPACVEAAGAASQGIFATVPSVDAASTPGAAAVIAAYKASFRQPADYGPDTVAAYDAAAILYSALDRAILAAGGKLPPRSGVVSELAGTSGFSGATGTIGFDPAGDSTHRVVSLYEPQGSDPKLPWRFVQAIDYSAALPF